VLLERRLRRSRSGSRTAGRELDRGHVTQRAVRPVMIVILSPLPSQPLGGRQALEHLQRQELVPESAVETLGIPVLPRAANSLTSFSGNSRSLSSAWSYDLTPTKRASLRPGASSCAAPGQQTNIASPTANAEPTQSDALWQAIIRYSRRKCPLSQPSARLPLSTLVDCRGGRPCWSCYPGQEISLKVLSAGRATKMPGTGWGRGLSRRPRSQPAPAANYCMLVSSSLGLESEL
jgi:hypothetical protein